MRKIAVFMVGGPMISLLFGLSFTAVPGQAETYVAGQVGVTLPQDASNVELSNSAAPGVTFSLSDLELQTSVMYGAKLGHYFNSMKWLGVETEVFNTTPHVKQQSVTVNGAPFGVLTGAYLRVLTWAPINLVARYQFGQLEPYVGVGLGLFFANLKDAQTGESTSSTAPGLNTQVGLRYRVTNNVAIFAEWKYNRASFKFDQTPTAFSNIDADYSVNNVVFGVGYHF